LTLPRRSSILNGHGDVQIVAVRPIELRTMHFPGAPNRWKWNPQERSAT
jgi:hypothetical protein